MAEFVDDVNSSQCDHMLPASYKDYLLYLVLDAINIKHQLGHNVTITLI